METALTTREVFASELEAAKKQGANLLMPSTHIAGLSQYHQPIIERVQLSANPADGDVYPHDADKGKFRLTKQALMKLSVCAGITWPTKENKCLVIERDYVAYQAVGGLKKADGSTVFVKGEYDLDFMVVEEELRELYEKKATYLKDKSPAEKKDYVEYCIKRDILQKRKHKLKLAEAGAMNRVVRSLLGLKNAYTVQELSRPFLTVRIAIRPDYDDANVKRLINEAAVKAMFGVYGQTTEEASQKDNPEPIDVTIAEDESEKQEGGETAVLVGEEAAKAGVSHEQSSEATKTPPAPIDNNAPLGDPAVIDFQNSDEFGQCVAVTQLSERKGYNLSNYLNRTKKADLTALGAQKRTDLFKHLLSLPDKQRQPDPEPAFQMADDDIPF